LISPPSSGEPYGDTDLRKEHSLDIRGAYLEGLAWTSISGLVASEHVVVRHNADGSKGIRAPEQS
jgi:hypothetical protein